MMILEVTYREGAPCFGRSEIIEISLDKPLQDLREYFNAETVAVLVVGRSNA